MFNHFLNNYYKNCVPKKRTKVFFYIDEHYILFSIFRLKSTQTNKT